jgi:hypothetical protein
MTPIGVLFLLNLTKKCKTFLVRKKQCFFALPKKIAGIPEWPNGIDSSLEEVKAYLSIVMIDETSIGLVPSWVRILLPALFSSKKKNLR